MAFDTLDQITFSLLATVSDSDTATITETYDAFIARLTPTPAPRKSAVPLFSGTSFSVGRSKANATEVQLLVFDFDNKCDTPVQPETVCELLTQALVRSVVVSSYNHTREVPRFRVIVFLSEPILPYQFETAFADAVSQLGFTDPKIICGLDGASANLTQFYYLPSHPPGETPFMRVIAGEDFQFDLASSFRYTPPPRGPGRPRVEGARANQFTPAQIQLYWLTVLPQLQDRGNEWRCPCPLHRGVKPNFNVNKRTGFWHCFSECQAKGLKGGGIYHFHHLLRNSQLPPDMQIAYKDAVAEVSAMIGTPTPVSLSHYQQVVATSHVDQVPDLLAALEHLPEGQRAQAARALATKHQIPDAVIAEHVVPSRATLGGPLNFLLGNDARTQRIWDTYQTRINTDKYDLDEQGLYRLQEVGQGDKRHLVRRDIGPQPVWITALSKDPATGDEWVHLHWQVPGESVQSRWVLTRDLRSGAFKNWPDFPWDANRVNQVSEYLNDSIASVAKIETRPMVVEIGWQMALDPPRLVLYPELHDEDVLALSPGPLQRRGSMKPWREMFEWLLKQPFEDVKMFWSALGMSAAAPLVRHMQVRNPILVVATSSSKGKSVVVAVAQNLWGNWRASHSGANSTARATEDMVTLHQDVPYMIDEFQRHVGRNDFRGAEDLIYNFGNGQRRQKIDVKAGRVIGGEVRHGVVLMTSEDDFFSQLAEGARNRCIVMRGAPLPNPAAAEFLKMLYPHYGVVGPKLEALYTEHLRRHLLDVQLRVNRLRKKLESRGVETIGDDIPAIALAGQGLSALSEIFGMTLPVAATVNYMLSILHPQREVSVTEKFDTATRCFIDLLERVQNAPWGTSGPLDYAVVPEGPVAVRGNALMQPDASVFEVMLGTRLVGETLRRHGLREAVFNDWLRRGYLVRNTARQNAHYKHRRANARSQQSFAYEGTTVLLVTPYGVDVAAGVADPNAPPPAA